MGAQPEGLLEIVMAHDRLKVLARSIEQGVVPVFSDPDPDVCVAVVDACGKAGAKCVEFTNRGDGAFAAYQEVARRLAGSDITLGVGSIVDAPTAALYLSAGANFVVGPTTNPEVARLCNRRGVAYSPGCGTATEISAAQELGCEIVKVFPGSAAGGPDFVRAILGPMPWTKMMPTGGVEANEGSLKVWFDAGIVACGIGSDLITRALLDARDYSGIEARVRDTLMLARDVRGR